MNQGFDPRDASQIQGFDGKAGLMFLFAARGVSAEIANLERQTGSQTNEKTFFNNLAQPQGAAVPPKNADGLFPIRRHFPVVIGNENSQRGIWPGPKVILNHLGQQ